MNWRLLALLLLLLLPASVHAEAAWTRTEEELIWVNWNQWIDHGIQLGMLILLIFKR